MLVLLAILEPVPLAKVHTEVCLAVARCRFLGAGSFPPPGLLSLVVEGLVRGMVSVSAARH